MRDLLLLELRNAIADKEFYTAQANADLAKYGEWRCNWSECSIEVSRRIVDLTAEIRDYKEPTK